MVLLHFMRQLQRSYDFDFVVDDAPLKQGTYCPGTSIPVHRPLLPAVHFCDIHAGASCCQHQHRTPQPAACHRHHALEFLRGNNPSNSKPCAIPAQRARHCCCSLSPPKVAAASSVRCTNGSSAPHFTKANPQTVFTRPTHSSFASRRNQQRQRCVHPPLHPAPLFHV